MNHTELFNAIRDNALSSVPFVYTILPDEDAAVVRVEDGTFLAGVRCLVADIGPSGTQVAVMLPNDEDRAEVTDLPTVEHYYLIMRAAYIGEVLHVTRSGADNDAELVFDDKSDEYLRMYYPEQSA